MTDPWTAANVAWPNTPTHNAVWPIPPQPNQNPGWPTTQNPPAPADPLGAPNWTAKYDNMSKDDILLAWDDIKNKITALKEQEMDLRKYIVKRAFPTAVEGTNKQELGNGYELKAVVKFNYKLEDNKKVEAGLDKISAMGNDGSFIAERLVSWTPNFLLTEYRELQRQADEGNPNAKEMIKIVSEFLIITDAAPTLEIKAPKK